MGPAAALTAALVAGTATPAVAGPRDCIGNLCQVRGLAPFFAKLSSTGQPQGSGPGRPVHILQLGDSHTAGDAITGSWRDILQARYGGGGRGAMAVGRPYNGYLSYGITASMSPGWSVRGLFGRSWEEAGPPLGLSGFTLSASEGATASLQADSEAQHFNSFVLCGMAGPGQGAVAVHMGFAKSIIDFNSFASRPQCQTVAATGPQSVVTVRVERGTVNLTSWGTFADRRGVALSNLGVVGAQLTHLGRASEHVIAEELRAYRPDLIVIAFGTNEGFNPRVRPDLYETELRAQLVRVRRLAGDVPLLLLGAPDAASRNPALHGNGPGAAIDCNNRHRTIDQIVAALTAETTDGAATEPAEPSPQPEARPLFVPPGLGAVREVQRMVAAELDISFWDWQAAMGGVCASADWARRAEPLMRGDFVHFKKAGGAIVARALQDDLAAAMAAATD